MFAILLRAKGSEEIQKCTATTAKVDLGFSGGLEGILMGHSCNLQDIQIAHLAINGSPYAPLLQSFATAGLNYC